MYLVTNLISLSKIFLMSDIEPKILKKIKHSQIEDLSQKKNVSRNSDTKSKNIETIFLIISTEKSRTLWNKTGKRFENFQNKTI